MVVNEQGSEVLSVMKKMIESTGRCEAANERWKNIVIEKGEFLD